MGNLTADPELRYTPKGTAVTDLRLAINRYYVADSGGGDRQEETTFVDVTLWSRQAEIAKEYLTKGSPAFIEGRLQLDSWEDKQSGQKRTKLRVIGENVQLLGSRGNEGGSPPKRQAPSSGGSANQRSSPPPPMDDMGMDDDIPF